LVSGTVLALLTALLGAGAAARKRTSEELDRTVQVTRDLICTAGFDGFFKHINPAFERTLGYTREELLARPFLEFVHEDDRARTAAEAARLSEGDETIAFVNRYRCRDGTYRWLEWTAIGAPEHGLIYAAARDISEPQRAEA